MCLVTACSTEVKMQFGDGDGEGEGDGTGDGAENVAAESRAGIT